MFWALYYFLVIVISAISLKLFKKKILKVLFFSFFFSIMSTPWFINPGSESLAPIISILILENSIIENHGIQRILRPFSVIFFITFVVVYFFYYFRFKN